MSARKQWSFLLAALLLTPALARTQQVVVQPAPGTPCQGFTYLVHTGMAPGSNGELSGIRIVGYPLITDVPQGTPASVAGILPEDSLVSVNGKDITTTPRAMRVPSGDTITIRVKRGTELKDFTYRMGVRQAITDIGYSASTDPKAPTTRCVAVGAK